MTGTSTAAMPVSVRGRPGWHRALYGSGYALVLSSALTSGIGFLFWIVAARSYDQSTVGENSALIFAIMFLAGVAQLNLLNVLIRFVPVAGRRASRFVLAAYLVGGGLAGVVGLGFALGAPIFSPALAGVLHGSGPVLGFGAGCAVWAIFVMQDGVLAAVRRARVVTVENAVFSLAKLGFVVVLARLLPLHGIIFAWMAATAIVVLATNIYLFARALPRYVATAAERTDRIPLRGVLGYVGGDYLGTLCWLACTQLLPVLVLSGLGATATAVFSMVWTIAYALYLVPAGMGQSLVAHASVDGTRLDVGSRGVVRRSLLLLTPAVALLLVAAPLVLRILGPDYVVGSWALRFAALSALPNVITACAVSTARVQRRMVRVVGVLAAISALVIGLAFWLMPSMGITGVGLALLIAQTVVAAVVLLAGARWLPRPIVGPFANLRNGGLLRRVGPVALAGLSAGNGGARWRVQGRLHGRSDTAIALIGTDAGESALLKVVDSSAGVAELRRQTRVLAELHADDRLAVWRELVPRILHSGATGTGDYVVESRLSGVDARPALTDPARRGRFVRAAASTISELHRRTASPRLVDEKLLARWVSEPADRVRAAVSGRRRIGLDRAAATVTDALRGRRCPVGWTHGDFSADNVLLDDGGRITGVVDWGQADSEGLVILDVASLLLATESEASGRELGQVLLDWLRDGDVVVFATLAAAQGELGGDPLDARALLLLGWLRMVAGNLAKSPRYAANPVWMQRNVSAVLRAVADEGGLR